jgi:hypothetical protein
MMMRFLPPVLIFALCSTVHGQTTFPCPDALDLRGYDDGSSEFLWKIANPSGPSEWFSVDFDNSLASTSLVGLAVALDEYKPSALPTFSRIGIYGDNLTLSASGHSPDVSGASTIVEVAGGGVQLDGRCNYQVFSTPLIHIGSSNVHVAFQHADGDSALWLCSDTGSSPSGRSFFSTNGFASPALSFSVNWMLRAAVLPTGVGAGSFFIHGAPSATVEVYDTVALTFYGDAAGAPAAVFTAPPLPIGKVSPILFTGSGPLPTAWTFCAALPCTVPTLTPLPFQVFYLDASNTLQQSNIATLTALPKPCGSFCFGQRDDGGFDGFVFRASGPVAGSNDWFSVRHGMAPPSAFVNVLLGVEVATWDFCGSGGQWAEVGIYPANLVLSPSGSIPDLNNPLATVGGASAPITAGAADWGYPASFYNTANVPADLSTIYHTAAQWDLNDTCIWIAADSTASGPDPCGVLPNTSSFSSTDGYLSTVGHASTLNWMIKLDWN